MGLVGSIIFIVMLIIFLIALRNFTIFIGGVWRADFKSKEFALFVLALIAFVALFQITDIYHEELGIPTICAQGATTC